jgi:sigma-B regulation protein RsbU (phosphoserine phosphatase)
VPASRTVPPRSQPPPRYVSDRRPRAALKPLEIDGEKFIISTVRDLTERKRVEREVLVAREIQQALLPTALPSIPGLDISAHERSAQPTCGDFFDFVAGSGGSSVITVGDISGHGFGPAILMASVMSYLRAFARGEMALDRILARTNDLLYEETRPEDFATALVVRVDPKNRVLEYGNAGHPAGWVLDTQGAVKDELRGTGVPLGMFARAEYRSVSSLLLRPGDTVVLYTDGISEAESPDGSQFGDGRILEAVREHLGENARRITESLFSAVRDFTHGDRPLDDMTAVIIKVGDEHLLPPTA